MPTDMSITDLPITDLPIVEQEPALLRHPRLAALATSAWPAWLWSADGSRMLWANAVGAAMFGAATVAAATQRRFDRRLSRPDRPAGRDTAFGRTGAARKAARLRRRLQSRADLRLLAHHRGRRRERGTYRRHGAGRTGAIARRARPPPVRRSSRAHGDFPAERNARLRHRSRANARSRGSHARGTRPRSAGSRSQRNRQRQGRNTLGRQRFPRRRPAPWQRRRRCPRVHFLAADERSSAAPRPHRVKRSRFRNKPFRRPPSRRHPVHRPRRRRQHRRLRPQKP